MVSWELARSIIAPTVKSNAGMQTGFQRGVRNWQHRLARGSAARPRTERILRIGNVLRIGGALRAPRRQSLFALRANAPSRGDPPHDGRFAQHYRPKTQRTVGCVLNSKFVVSRRRAMLRWSSWR